MTLPQKDNQECAYLSKKNGCEIYEKRPTMCRIFDCRDYVATGLVALMSENDTIGRAALQWDLATSLKTKADWYTYIALCSAASSSVDNVKSSGEIAGLAFLNYENIFDESIYLHGQIPKTHANQMISFILDQTFPNRPQSAERDK